MRALNDPDQDVVSSRSSIEREILRTTMIAYAEELGATLEITAPTVDVSQAREFAIAIADASGSIVATDNPLQLASMAQTVRHVAEYFEFDLSEGDVVATNDPYAGGTHLTDVTLVAPLMHEDELVLFLAARVRIRDVGGQVSGSVYPGASEILAEGHPLTPVKIQRHGRPVKDMLRAFLLNGRRPIETRRTLDAASAALTLGQRRIAELLGRYGVDAVRPALAYAQRYSERLTRSAVAAWQPGTYDGERVIDLDPAAGGPLAVRLTATVDEDGLRLDFAASDDQRPLFVNSSAGTTASCALGAVLAMLGDAVPANSGVLRMVRVQTRPGSAVDPRSPAPIGWGAPVCGRAVTEIVGATLGPAVAGATPSLTVPRPLLLSRPESDRSAQTDLGRWGIGGASAVADADGWGPPQLSTRAQLPSVEHWETEESMRVERLELVEDTGGAGQWRGAPGVEAIIVLDPDRRYTLWTQASDGAVDGLAGGLPGGPGTVELHTASGWEAAPVSAVEQPIAADRLRLRMAGGGGFGDPTARDRAAVLDDVADGLVSSAAARDVYRMSAAEREGSDTNHG